LGVLDQDDVVMLTYREGTLPVRFVWKEGDRLPCTSTALGKAILMHLSDEEITRHLGEGGTLRGLTERSLRTRQQLDAELVEVRQRGWALQQEESNLGVTAVGSAILDGNGYPIAGISVSFFDYPPDPARKEACAKVVVDAARNLSKQVAE